MKNKKYYNHLGKKYKVFALENYPSITVKNKTKHLHRMEWEKHNGKIPKGMDIYFKDGNKKNWNIKNLMMDSRMDHFRTLAKWKRKKNGEWFSKWCKDCKKYLPFDKFYFRKAFPDKYKDKTPRPTQRCKKHEILHQKKRSMTKEFKKKRREYMRKYYLLNKNRWIKKKII